MGDTATMDTTNMDFELARFNMIEQQIRPWNVLNPEVLDLLMKVKRENFVPPAYRSLAFADLEIPLSSSGTGQTAKMWPPRVEARALQELAVKSNERVLEIGTGSGFFAALLAAQAREVVSIEIEPALAQTAIKNLTAAGIHNVRVEVGCGANGWAANAPYDVIVITGGVEEVPPGILKQLNVGGRLLAIIGKDQAANAQLITQTAAGAYSAVDLFEAAAEPLRNLKPITRFEF